MIQNQRTEGVRSSFVRTEEGEVCIMFFDPCYVRSDAIVIDLTDLSVRAVLHESEHLVGRIDEDLADALEGREHVLLGAEHYKGHTVNLRAPLHLKKREAIK